MECMQNFPQKNGRLQKERIDIIKEFLKKYGDLIFWVVMSVLLATSCFIEMKEEADFKSRTNTLASQIEELQNEQVAFSLREEEYDRALQMFKDELEEMKDNLSEIQKTEETVVIEENEIVISTGKWEVGQELAVPAILSEVKLFTDYRKYNIEGTPHNRLQNAAYTDENGCRRYGEDYLVALGSYYSTDIGDRFEITLDTGNIFTVMLADGKNDKDLDECNMYYPCETYGGYKRANLIEFIIDSDVLAKEVYGYGSLDKIPELQGSVTKIVYLGRDESGDWTTYA